MNLSQQEIEQLKKAGYTQQQINQAIAELEAEDRKGKLVGAYNQAVQSGISPTSYNSTFQYNPTDNLVKWQLELNDILERAEHILREDIVMVENGAVVWKPNPQPMKRIFSEYAVQEILRVLSMYINRNTILSDYEPQEINDKVFDFGKEVNDLVFMKYEDFGLTTIEKRKNYPMLIRQLIDIVHSAYKRAQYGAEKDSLRTARSIMQQEQITPPHINIQTGEARQQRGLLNPMRYIGGKYK